MLRPHFSLRTLLLAMLALGAAAALWRNYEPWRIEGKYFGAPQASERLSLSPDEKWILADFTSDKGRDRSFKNILWNTETGKAEVLINDSWTGHEQVRGRSLFSDFSKDSARVITGYKDGGDYINLRMAITSSLKTRTPTPSTSGPDTAPNTGGVSLGSSSSGSYSPSPLR